MRQTDLDLSGGRTLRVYDTGGDGLPVFWHHGTPNTGAPPQPLFAAAERLGVRWISHDRPGYGGSTPVPDRDIALVASDVAGIADSLGVERFAVMGHSGGGPHALACAALLPDRVRGAVAMSSMAPLDASGLDWFAGMAKGSAAGLRAAAGGRAVKEAHEATAEFDPETFTPADHAALSGGWSWLLEVVRPAIANGPAALIDDDLAYTHPWGFDLAVIKAPVLIVHGGKDRMIPSTHSTWLAERVPGAELWIRPEDGHVSVLNSAEAALEWLVNHAG
jgi:pimeloyl-ACP methyl ester carboxylesterase